MSFLTVTSLSITAFCSNAFIIPVVYFFYPETAYRSLEEMDAIFRKSTGWYHVVKVSKEEPRWHDKDGRLIINYEETDAHRNKSVVSARGLTPMVENA